MDYQERLKELWKNKQIILQHCKMPEESGIYMFHRYKEDGGYACYIGQAKNLLKRTAEHLMGRKQHIDKSLYKRKWISEENPYGWQLDLISICPQEELDKLEKMWIDYFKNLGYELYNVTGGGQFDKAEDINARYEVKLKTYRNGKNKGAEKVREKIKTYFEKYLDVSIKGKPTKIKERKLEEFKKFIEM